MIPTYEIRLKDQAGGIVARFHGGGRGLTGGGLQRFSYQKEVREPGPHSLVLQGDDERIDLFELDGQVEFWRNDLVWGSGWYLDYEGFHRYPEFTLDDQGREVFIARGVGYNCLLASDTIQYAAGSAQCCKTMACETAAKEFVDENIGPGAGLDALGNSRVRLGLAVQADAATGAVWDGCRAYKNLLDILIELADYAPADFMVVGTGPATFEFQWAADQWGDDHTFGSADPTVFSARLGNVDGMTQGFNRIDEVNIVNVLGSGLAAARTIETRQNAALLAGSPWARRAVARDARDTDVVARLQARGDAVLNEQEPKRDLSFGVLQTIATRYGRDWDLGDLVSVEYRGWRVDVKVTAVTVSMASDGAETIIPTVEAVSDPVAV